MSEMRLAVRSPKTTPWWKGSPTAPNWVKLIVNVVVYSQGLITIEDSTKISNTQFVSSYDPGPGPAAVDINLGNEFGGVTIQSLGDVSIKDSNELYDCLPSGEKGPLGDIEGEIVRLVD